MLFIDRIFTEPIVQIIFCVRFTIILLLKKNQNFLFLIFKVTQETTLGNWNAEIWKYVTPETVPASVRVVLANRLATTGPTWVELFQRYNSGTYNNQWMVLDYNLFTPGEPLKPGTFWILEQAPGTVQMADRTMLLDNQGFWSSYNIA